MEGDFTWDVEHALQYTDDVSQNCTPETYTILITNVTPISSTFFKKRKNNFSRKKEKNRMRET